MPGYILMHAEVTDPDEYEQFKAAAAKAIEDHGGRYLVRGGLSTSLEGDFGSRVILVEFPSYQDALGFYHSEAYQDTRPQEKFDCDLLKRVSWSWTACQPPDSPRRDGRSHASSAHHRGAVRRDAAGSPSAH